VEPSQLLLRPVIGLLYQPWMINDDSCGEVDRMNNCQAKPKYPEKSARGQLCPLMPHDFTLDRSRTAVVGSWRVTACATARPSLGVTLNIYVLKVLGSNRIQGTGGPH
jgi:hypothetical protein